MRVSLNLLPPNKKAALRTGFVFAYIQTMLFILFLVIAFASGTLLAVRLMFKSTYDDLAKRSGDGAAETNTIATDIKAINDYLKRIDAFNERTTHWSQVFGTLTQLVPEGVRLVDVRVDKQGKLMLSGIARERQDVLTLQSRLEQSTMFKDVRAPLSNILQQKDVRFDFELQFVKLAE